MPFLRLRLPLLMSRRHRTETCPHGTIVRNPESPTCGDPACHRRWWRRYGLPIWTGAAVIIAGCAVVGVATDRDCPPGESMNGTIICLPSKPLR